MAEIFEHTRIGGLTLPNRLVRSATWEGMAEHDGAVTPALVALYETLAQGGVGLIISSYITVHPQGRQHADQIGGHDDAHVQGLSRIAEAVHRHGRPIVGQIAHCGGQSQRGAMGGLDPLAPSAVKSPGYPEVPRAMSEGEIEEVKESFARTALRLQHAGFDGVQLHGAHGFLLSQFLSPSRNRRDDRYGGSLENRSRFTLEVFDAVRQAVGPAFPILIKLNANDFIPDSTTEVDATFLAQRLAEAGIDAIEVSGGTGGSGKYGAARPRIEVPEGEAYFLPQARAIREVTAGLPLILVGGIRSPETVERILDEGVADCFAMSRPLIREPDLPNRWARGERTRSPCVSCLGCFGPARRGEGIRCVDKERSP